MAVRDDFTAGEVLAAADLNDTFASKPPFAYGTATPSTTVEGFIFYDENVTPPAPKFWDGSAFQSFGGGKVLQVVRATDTTLRSTTSTSFVDASISVTITPQKSTSTVLLVWACRVLMSTNAGFLRISDSSNNAISGAEEAHVSNSGTRYTLAIIAWDSPATTSAKTYKGRFNVVSGGTIELQNNLNTGQLYAIEVSA
jgi:hypothetical protein